MDVNNLDVKKSLSKDFVYIDPDAERKHDSLRTKLTQGNRLWFVFAVVLMMVVFGTIGYAIWVGQENLKRTEMDTGNTEEYFYGAKSEAVRYDESTFEKKGEADVVSDKQLQYVVYENLKLATGSSETKEFTVGKVQSMQMLFDGDLDGEISLVGSDLKERVAFSTDNDDRKWESEDVKIGKWTIKIEADQGIDGLLAVGVEGGSYSLSALTSVYKSSGMVIRAELKDSGLRTPQVAMTGEIIRHEGGVAKIRLYDDGKHNDGGEQDGVFGYVTGKLDSGGYTVIVRARGQGFERIVTSPFFLSTYEEK